MRILALAAILPLALTAIPDSGCGGEDPHSDPDLHACHHAEKGATVVEASLDADAAPYITTTQESHSHWDVDLARSGDGYAGYVYFEGLMDGDIYVAFWKESDTTLSVSTRDDFETILPLSEADASDACDAFSGRNEYPIDAEGYFLFIESDLPSVELFLEAMSQYPDTFMGD